MEDGQAASTSSSNKGLLLDDGGRRPNSSYRGAVNNIAVKDADDEAEEESPKSVRFKLLSEEDQQHRGAAAAVEEKCGRSSLAWELQSSVDYSTTQIWSSIRVFCVAICFLILVHSALTIGYIPAMVTTLEKRFEIRSRTSGLVVSSYELGSLFSVLSVSYFGSRGHIPRYMALGAVLLAFGSLLFALPHFLASDVRSAINVTTINTMPAMCNPTLASTTSPSPLDFEQQHELDCQSGKTASRGSHVYMLVIAQILLGVGGSPIFTLGTTYIDNHLDKERSAFYLAFMYATVAVGPVLGFLLGALFLSKWINPPQPADLPDSAFVGLWWAGFLLLGVLYFCAALPFFRFPKQMTVGATDTTTTTTTTNTTTTSSNSSNNMSADALQSNDAGAKASWKEVPLSILGLLCNGAYLLASLVACVELAIVSGFTLYLPKYLETQFGLTKSLANISTGGVALPGAIVGILMGGYLTRRLKLQLRGMSIFIVCTNVLALILVPSILWVGCENIQLAGVLTKYNRTERFRFPNPLEESSLKISDPCNRGCGCSPDKYEPVCGIDGKTYFSPCFAGCTRSVLFDTDIEQPSIKGRFNLKKVNYTDCWCIRASANRSSSSLRFENGSSSAEPVAFLDPCEAGCSSLAIFLIGVFIVAMIASNNQMPLVMTTLRAVSEEEKAFALGLQVVLLRLLAYIPAPVMFGWVIDTTCLIWKTSSHCEHDGNACLLYDIETFRVRYGTAMILLKVTATLISVLLAVCIQRRLKGRPEPFSQPITMSEVAHRLGEWENLHISAISGLRRLRRRQWLSDESLHRPNNQRRHGHQKTLSC